MNLEFFHHGNESNDDAAPGQNFTRDLTENLLKKMVERHAVIGVIGLGYVGLPFALSSAKAGFRTIGIDTNNVRVDALRSGRSFLSHIETSTVAAVRKKLQVYGDYASLRLADVIVICVPTPITTNCTPDLSAVEEAADALGGQLRRGQLVILTSTSFPGTTEKIVGTILEKRSGLKVGRDFLLAFSPEREDPGNSRFTAQQVPRVVGGADEVSVNAAEALFNSLGVPTVRVSSTQTAEAVKLLENTFRAVNIAFVNELKTVFGRMDIDIWEVIAAAQTKPFGYMPFFPGPGVGGHCIAADPYYLIWRAREFHVSTRLTEMACDINRLMPEFVINGLIRALDTRLNRGLSGAQILIVGVAYKRNVDDVRDSPALRIMQLLEERGAVASFQDPLVPVLPSYDEYQELAGRAAVVASDLDYATYDSIVIVTDHDTIDYIKMEQNSPLLIDTRNAFERRGISTRKVVKL